MPSYTRGQKRDQLVYVAVNPILMYGFKTKDLASITGVSAADLTTQLGHTAAGAIAAGRLLCIGANAPKPPRVSKRVGAADTLTQSSVSTFCAYDRLSAALANGWSLAKQGREVGLRTDGRSITAIVPIATGGVRYAFSMNAADFQAYGADLGLESAASLTTAADINSVVMGSSLPKPGRASKRLPGGSISTFYNPDKKIDLQQPAAGWRVQSSARLLENAAAAGGGA